MKSRTRIWFGIGVGVLAGSATAIPNPPAHALDGWRSGSVRGALPGGWLPMQHADHATEAGEAGEGGVSADLPPETQVALSVALMRGHLLVGDELVTAGLWDAALPHFLHPTEELYSGIKDKLAEFKTPPFDGALLALAAVVKQKNRAAYAAARQKVDAALAAAETGVKEKQADWPAFQVEIAMLALEAAGGEYANAIVKGRIAKPVEYQDSRGFVLTAERMIERVKSELAAKNADALKKIRAGFAVLKRAWPSAVPPKTPAKSAGAVLGDISRIRLAASGLN